MDEGGVTLVTGGGGGLGIAVARRVAGLGRPVALLGREAGRLEAARRALGGRTMACAADVGSRTQVEAAVASVRGALGPVTALVNAAGVAVSSPVLPPDDELWERTLRVNATGAWVVTTAVLPDMRASGRGAVVNVASTAALRGYRYTAAYVASKHALLGLTRALAEDLRDTGVTVNAVCPGFLDTPMTDATVAAIVRATGQDASDVRSALAELNASGRLLPPDEVAEVILGLLGDPNRTGEAVVLE